MVAWAKLGRIVVRRIAPKARERQLCLVCIGLLYPQNVVWIGAGEENRTLYIQHGKLTFYQ